MFDLLPKDLLIEVLSSSPVKLLLKCRCVCKAWDSIITDPLFISKHLKKSTERNRFIMYCADGGTEHYLLYTKESFPGKPVEEFDCPWTSLSHLVNIVGSCNGVLCLSDDIRGVYPNRVALWNPSVRKIVTIPCPEVKLNADGEFCYYSLGFGFDSKSDDYKFVRIVYMADNVRIFSPPLVEIYSSKNRYWRNDVEYDLKSSIRPFTSAAFVNGACHWVASKPGNGGGEQEVIVSFDLGEEVFREMEIPNCLVNKYVFMDVAVFDGSLLLVAFVKEIGLERSFSVWRIAENGVSGSWTWTKLFSTSHLEGIGRFVAFRQNEEVLLERISGLLVLYDFKTEEISDTGISGKADYSYFDIFVDSLVLMAKLEVDASSSSSRMVIDKASGQSKEA
ncbi:F-box/kelch-repeat protein At3g23880 [Manihot esculenta]|uniref:F-box domain-containing protein n=1 Tax=Manihot esculenta TaxID=3983 RepID=A0A2C9VKE0_MANES|nr:F-box/kelch-repeat protein At3g23880 [Manihot esculenta]OAY45188.1 hypothetical protein MANES_07G039200v8 [Manihot esculenta]